MTARRARNTTRQGANFELQIMDDLARRGYDVLRSSGSRGKVDVVALGDGQTLFIQAKISQPVIPPAERRGLIGLTGRTLEGWPIVAYRVRGNVCYRVLTGLGPKEFVPFEPEICKRAECSVCQEQFRDHNGPGDACPSRLDGVFTLRERKDRVRKPKNGPCAVCGHTSDQHVLIGCVGCVQDADRVGYGCQIWIPPANREVKEEETS